MTKRKDGLAQYENVGDDYLHRRKLKKSAGWILLWSMGVGAVISGNYFGWNMGLKHAGFWGMAAATILMAVMYVCMVFSIAELSAALPHAGGFYSFVRNALGPTAGFICGMTDTIEYILSPAVIVIGIGGYLNTLIYGNAPAPHWTSFLWWTLSYGIFVYINLRSVELTLKIGLVITGVAVSVLLLFFGATLFTGAFDTQLLFNIEPTAGHTANGLPFGSVGIFTALPFAIWFFLAIEQLPLAAEETHDVVRDMPKALIWSIMTLLVLSVLTLILNTGIGGGAATYAESKAPLADGVVAVLGTGFFGRLLITAALAGLIASFHAIIYAYGRVLFSLSRAGYFPRWISIVNQHHAPQSALIIGAVVGLGCAFVIDALGEENKVGAALLSMAVFGAVISYALVLVSFIRLRLVRPEMERPYRSPLGIPGAVVGLLLAVVSMVACFGEPSYRSAVVG
ncbi:MAG: amino acid permease, partial [Planctomycetales bacterium]|nr:amino acid permease [Planctomycetales bacterium]